MKAIKYFSTYSRTSLMLFSFLVAVLIGVVRYMTGHELALSLFYLFPVGIVAWNVGKWPGIVISVACAASWLIADLTLIHNFSSIFVPYINEMLRLIVFIIVTNIIVELRNALKKQTELARTDPLTGISNRRAFFESADIELNKARRYRYPISILYLDIDNFKEINDKFGHTAGDTLLCLVAKTLKSNIRSIDIVSRLGGDEFGILIARTDAKASYSVAKKILTKLSGLVKVNGWPITFSIGLAIFEVTPNSVYEMVEEADMLMYSVKNNGKNRIKHEVFANNDYQISIENDPHQSTAGCDTIKG